MSQRNEIGAILLGVLLVFGMHISAISIVFLIGSLLSAINIDITFLGIALFGIGISQLMYVIPVIFWARSKQKWGLMKGVIIGAVITALLNGGCWIILASQIKW